MSDRQIPRGSDLTEDDIALLADDVVVVCAWCMRNRLKRDRWAEQIRETLKARIGRRPLVVASDK